MILMHYVKSLLSFRNNFALFRKEKILFFNPLTNEEFLFPYTSLTHALFLMSYNNFYNILLGLLNYDIVHPLQLQTYDEETYELLAVDSHTTN